MCAGGRRLRQPRLKLPEAVKEPGEEGDRGREHVVVEAKTCSGLKEGMGTPLERCWEIRTRKAKKLSTGLACLALWHPLGDGGHEGELGQPEGEGGEDEDGGSSLWMRKNFGAKEGFSGGKSHESASE